MNPNVDVVQELHHEAEAVIGEAIIARFQGCLDDWKRLMLESAALERAAAACAEDTPDYPMRARRLQDAAQKYFASERYGEGLAVIKAILAENPPALIYLQLIYLRDSVLKHRCFREGSQSGGTSTVTSC